MFRLWNFECTGRECRFDATPAEFAKLTTGSTGWVKACLATYGVSGDISSFELRPTHSSYFSDYLDSDDWRDRWQPVWRVSVAGTFAEPGPSGESALECYRTVHATDEEADGGGSVDSALVIGAQRLDPAMAREEALPSLLALAAEYEFSGDRVQTEVRQVAPGKPADEAQIAFMAGLGGSAGTGTIEKMRRAERPLLQIRLVVKSVSLPDDEERLAALREAMRSRGYLVHCHEVERDAMSPLA